MKKAGLVILFSIIYVITFAQAHTYNACCRYGKGNVMGDCVCPGCKKDKDDEIKASQEETKQLQAKAAAEQAKKVEADKKAKEEAEQKKIADQKLKEDNKITIGNPNPEKTAVKKTDLAKNITDKTVMISFDGDYRNKGFKDTLGNIIFYTKRDNIVQQGFENSGNGGVGTFDNRSYLYSFPRNMGLIEFTYGFGGITASGISRYVKTYVDIVYPNGKLEFSDEKITSIFHLINEWFVLTKRVSRESDEQIKYLYNLNTKQNLELPQLSMEYGQALKIVPIYKEVLYKVPSPHPYFAGESLYNESKQFKNALMTKYPEKINEKLLEENILGILIGSSSSIFYIEKGDANRFKIAYLTKEGKLIYK